MYKERKEQSKTKVSQEAAFFTKDGKVLTAFLDKESRAEFEKLIKEAIEDSRLPKDMLEEAKLIKEAIETGILSDDMLEDAFESGDDVEIDIKVGTEADGFHQYQQALPFKSIVL